MIETHTSISKRILAGLFAMLMVLSLVPGKTLIASATNTYPDSYTVTVTDGTGDIVKGAVVKITSNTVDVELDLNGTTDENGVAAFESSVIDAAMASLDGSTAEVKITVTKEDYKAFETEAVIVKNNTSANVNITLLKEITDVFNVEGKTLTFSPAEQELVAVTPGDGVDTDKYAITYSVNDGAESEYVPVATDLGVYNIKVIIAKKTEDGTAIDEDYEKIEKIVSTTISAQPTFSVTVTPVANFTYDGGEHELVEISGLDSNDVVSYSLDNGNNWSDVIPKATNAGTYSVKVKVERAGYADFVSDEKTVVISKATYTGISITANSLQYKEDENKAPVAQELVTVTGLPENTEGAKTWYLDGNEVDSLPKASAVRTTDISGSTYKVSLEIAGSTNYEAWSSGDIEVEIGLGDIDVSKTGLDIEALSETLYYTGNPQQLLKKATVNSDYEIQFRLGEDGSWGTTIPEATNVGTYTVYVQIVRANYNKKQVEGYFPISVVINKAEQTPLVFANENFTANGETTFELSEVETDNIYNFSVKDSQPGDKTSGYDVAYTIESCVDDDNIDDIAEINSATDELKVKDAGIIKVTATRSGGDNYEDVTIECFINITKNSDITFSEPSKDCVLNVKGTVLSDQAATKAETEDNGAITYSFEDEGNAQKEYLTIDSDGNVTINNVVELASKIETAGGKLSVTIIADKAAGTKRNKYTGKDVGVYLADSTTYTLNISFETTPAAPYTLTPATPKDTGWFTDDVKVTAPTGYEIAKEINGSFDSYVTFNDNGTGDRYVYLKKNDGGITNKIAVKYNNENLKIDTKAPTDIKIEYSKSITDKILETVTLGFYNPSVTIKFTAEDATSGVKEFNWTYTNAEDASTSITPTETSGTVTAQKNNDGTYSATLTLTADEFDKANQYRGYIAVTATDNAGNVSDTVKDDGNVFVVDTISPELSVTYTAPTVTTDGTDFYGKDNSAVEFKLNVTEANFYEDVIGEDVIVKVTKDGGTPYQETPTWKSVVDENNKIVTDKYQGTFTLTEDGEYEITITYKDKSGNVMEMGGVETTTYTKSFTIDQTAPVIGVKCEERSDENTGKITVTAIFTVDEHNFDPNAVKVTGSVTTAGETKKFDEPTLLSEVLPGGTWKLIDGKYTYKFNGVAGEDFISGNYDLTVYCTDKATNTEEKPQKVVFTTDYDKPVVTEIKYSKSITDVILETVTLGFYNPEVKVTFTATDATSGVKEFNWTYTNAKYASTSITPTKTSGTETAQKNNDGTYSATLTLTADEFDKANQYRGYIAVKAIDNANNESATVKDDGNVFVVDRIAPELEISYTAPTVTTDGTDFYGEDNSAVEFKLKATEANFYPEDVKINVAKDGADPKPVQLADEDWSKGTNDVYTASFEIKGDGDYEITITYKDKSTNDAIITDGKDCKGTITTVEDESGNKTTTYTKSFTIDKTAPVISKVEFDKEVKVVSTKDNRNYYAAKQTATVTITEHNFDETGVNFIVKATDASGATITSLDRTINGKDLEWTVDANNSDKHIVTLTFEADANYTFDIECVDKATNAIEDYTANEFTVDKTAPNEDSLKVTYIESKTGKVAEVLSLGYFQNKVKVIITAEDATAGVNAFTYGYENAEGVSQVNGQLLDQKLKEADVKIEGNKTTATFTIPKSALGKGTQFNGNVKFVAIDRSGNQSEEFVDGTRIIVDNIAPVANVTFSDPVNTVGDISYYAGDINATITINEANFNAKDYKVVLTKDGVVDNISTDVKWTDESVDVHKGTFTIKADGDYFVELSGADKSGNKLKNYTSKQLTIDTDIKEPTFSINGAAKSGIGGAYKGDISVSFNYEDENFDNAEIKLVKTSLNSVEDVTSKYINANNEEKGGSGSFSIPAEVANDGIYTLTVNMNDKAKHTSSAELKFTVNRYGSVYEYSDYLISLIKDGGQYVTIKDGATAAITEDIVITEYNATPILSDSLKVLITRDGEVIEADYTTTPSNLDSATIGNSGWYQYVYTIKASNFAEDGVYKISLVSQYSANDAENNESTSVPENSIDSEGNEIVDTMTFTVDTKAPEIRNITNLEKSYIDADSVEVNYSIVDVGGLKSIEVIVNGKAVAEITDFKENLFSFDGSFTLKADTKEQTVQIIVTDLAGNVTDTSSEAFDTQGLYTFNPNVTVSTNIFVLWYANTPLFWGSIGGGVGVIGAAAVGVPKLRVRLRKRK